MARRTAANINRSTVLLLLAAILLPSLIFVALQFGFGYRAERQALETTTIARADAVMAQIDGSLQRARASALLMASAATIRKGDWRGAYERAREFAAINGDWKSVGLTDVQTGEELFDLRRPYGTSRKTRIDHRLVARLAREPVVFEGMRREGPGCPCLEILAAVRQDGPLRYVVTVALDPAAMQRQLVANAPREGLSALVDSNGRFIARTQNIAKRIGMPATRFVREAIRNGQRGIYLGVTYEGLENYTAFSTSPITGWSTHIAVPKAVFDTPRWWSRLASTVAFIISLALAVGLIWTLVRVLASQRSADERVQQAQRLEAVGKMTGGVAHDFNNMLAVVIGSLDIVRRRRAAGRDDFDRYIDNAMDGATRAADLTRRLLAFSRRQPLEPVATDLNHLLRGMKDLVSRTLNETIRLRFDLAESAWATFVDPGQFENAIVNLAANARDAMPSGGEMIIATANVTLTDGQAARMQIPIGDYVRTRVIDNGQGMSDDIVQHAFEPFFTTKDVGRGTGLGLSQIYGFIEQSGGRARILSQAGEGTTIELYLPRFDGIPVYQSLTGDADAPLPEGSPEEIILIAEDEEQVRMTNVDALRELGYSVRHASNGHEALKILESQPGISLLFTDIVMPGINGRELAAEARRRSPTLKLLFTTGYEREDEAAPDHDNESVMLRKPFAIGQLAQKIREVLDA